MRIFTRLGWGSRLNQFLILVFISMLIGIDASRAGREFKSGTEWYSYYLIRELAKIDSTNQYVLYSDKPLTGGLTDLTDKSGEAGGKIEMENGCQKIKSPHNNFKAKILNWPLTYFWTQIRLSWEMLFHSPGILFIPAHTLPVIHPRRSVVTIHDIGFERLKEVYSSDKIGSSHSLAGKFFDWLAKLLTGGKFSSNILDYHGWSTKFSLKHAKKIIAVSKFTKQELIDVYPAYRQAGAASESKIAVVYNGFNNDLYRPILDRREVRRVLDRYGIKPPYIFYVGRLEKKKNITGLVDAFVELREKYKKLNHKLVLVGNAGLGFDEVKYIIEEFDLDNEVIITGWVPEQDIPYIYSGAALFVFPSLYEGFGIPLLQAMALAIPIAASNIPAISEITAGAAWLFNPNDKNDMAEKIAQVLLDNKLAEDLVGRGQIRIKNFSLDKCAKETLAVIEGI
ncbi:MAG: Glycosyl transferase group 1 [Parcubacteria group bacterium GW2011_GWC2_42_12]|nr:MAG: Glycosyl transferase group 1 [Parcubacteria group bacterium GW2011_GWC2_42_12]KKT45184.1 MAG: Glycosyl transferase group 1 [Parcubacteria group bacterium GW2011_GWA2_44_15]